MKTCERCLKTLPCSEIRVRCRGKCGRYVCNDCWSDVHNSNQCKDCETIATTSETRLRSVYDGKMADFIPTAAVSSVAVILTKEQIIDIATQYDDQGVFCGACQSYRVENGIWDGAHGSGCWVKDALDKLKG